ncbi:MAG: hypothetical protein J6T14_08600 [Clostridia bacterium]|nr:hypothetical protein [Clostridia bacterium]MBP5271623.1 hypothetical protein [Clostridia bacterium]MBP5459948.1 hypothetical protein [Clostridia bacterium]
MKTLKAASLSPNGAIILAAVFTLFAVPLRTFQYLNCLDPETGFWTVRDVTVPVLYALVIAVAVFAFFISLFSGIMPKPEFSKQKDTPFGVAAILMGLGFASDAFFCVRDIITTYNSIVPSEDLSLGYQLISSGTIGRCGQALFAVLSVVYLAFLAVAKLTGTALHESHKLLALSPVLWGVFRLLVHFVEPISYKNVSQLLLEICLVVFAMIFWFAFARLSSGVNAESSMWLFFFGGITAAFLGFVCALAPFILILTGKASLIPPSRPMQYVDLAFAIFATCALFNAMPKTVGLNSRDEFKEEPAPEVPGKMTRAERKRERARLEKEAAEERAYQLAAMAATAEDGTIRSAFEDTGADVAEVDVDAPNPGRTESFWKSVDEDDGEHFVVTDEE